MTETFLKGIQLAADSIRRSIFAIPETAVVLGSGYGGFTERIRRQSTVQYRDIPGFPVSTVPGHAGELVSGLAGDCPILVMSGRAHVYEGNSPQRSAFPIFVLAALGVKTLILTNASGGIAPDLEVGSALIVRDHLFFPGFAGASPLVGLPAELGTKFVSLANAYDPELSTRLRDSIARTGLACREGVYAMVAGPHYETPAEIRFLSLAGADVVGMSTVPEAIAARQQGLRVAAISLVTNSHASSSEVNHLEVLGIVKNACVRVSDALIDVISSLRIGSAT